jgi:hypothetical protein
MCKSARQAILPEILATKKKCRSDHKNIARGPVAYLTLAAATKP